MKYYFLLVVLCALMVACSEPNYVPKPKAYARIDVPPAEYVPLPDSLPYFFEYSKHAQVLNDTSAMAERYWMEIYYPEFTANLDISYKKITDRKQFRDYVNDCYTLAQKHNIRAQAIDEFVTQNPQGYTTVFYTLEGDVPSHLQFFVTDSTHHFLRASLYFPSSTKNDSLAPLIDYVKNDMFQMMKTARWNTKKK